MPKYRIDVVVGFPSGTHTIQFDFESEEDVETVYSFLLDRIKAKKKFWTEIESDSVQAYFYTGHIQAVARIGTSS